MVIFQVLGVFQSIFMFRGYLVIFFQDLGGISVIFQVSRVFQTLFMYRRYFSHFLSFEGISVIFQVLCFILDIFYVCWSILVIFQIQWGMLVLFQASRVFWSFVGIRGILVIFQASGIFWSFSRFRGRGVFWLILQVWRYFGHFFFFKDLGGYFGKVQEEPLKNQKRVNPITALLKML